MKSREPWIDKGPGMPEVGYNRTSKGKAFKYKMVTRALKKKTQNTRTHSVPVPVFVAWKQEWLYTSFLLNCRPILKPRDTGCSVFSNF